MASKLSNAGRGAGDNFASSALRTIAHVAIAVGEGLRARNEYRDLVGHGADPAKAAAEALRHAEMH